MLNSCFRDCLRMELMSDGNSIPGSLFAKCDGLKMRGASRIAARILLLLCAHHSANRALGARASAGIQLEEDQQIVELSIPRRQWCKRQSNHANDLIQTSVKTHNSEAKTFISWMSFLFLLNEFVAILTQTLDHKKLLLHRALVVSTISQSIIFQNCSCFYQISCLVWPLL